MIGHKRVPSREGGIEKTVEQQMIRLCDRGHEAILYNRSGHNIYGTEYDLGVKSLREHAVQNGFDTSKSEEGQSREESSGRSAGSSSLHHGKNLRIETVPTPPGRLGVPVYSFLATLRALFGRCDVIYYHGSGSCLMIPLAKLFGARCAAMLHGIDSQRAKWGRFGKLYLRLGERAAARHADACFVLSENMQKYMRETYGAETILTWNGAEAPKIQKGAIAVQPASQVLPEAPEESDGRSGILLEEGNFILSLVRIVPEKGLHYLIRAFRKCRTDKKLVIAGGVDPACRNYYEKLRCLAGDDERILFTGFVEEPLVSRLYLNAYAFVLPSDLEGMAHSLLEAMAAGCCCLVSDIPENVSVLQASAKSGSSGLHGVVFRHSDVKDLREKLQFLLDHPETAEQFREESSSYILDKYSWDACVDQLEQVFQSL